MDIAAVGWACPIGLCSGPAYAALRAGFRVIEDDEDDPRRGPVSKLADDEERVVGATRQQRALFFAGRAVGELLRHVEPERGVQVCLAGPDQDASGLDLGACWAGLHLRGLQGLAPQLPATARVHGGGRAGVFMALSTAAQLLEGGAASQVLVGCFDSLAASDTPRGLAHRRGRVAGEGAAFMLLTRRSAWRQALVRVHPPVVLCDPAPYASGGPSRAAGLTELFRALTASRDARVDVLFGANPTGDWWARELSYAYLRNAGGMPEPLRVTSVYEHVGDAGAVNGAAALVAATRALTPLLPGRRPEHQSAIVYASSDRGDVGGCWLETMRSSP